MPTFKFGNLDLDLVDDYVYLGICFNWNGSFVKAKKLLHDKASKAMYSLIQKGRRLKLPADIMLKLFDSCVVPILLYGCEVWGYENTDIIEKVHTKFCKFIFGVSKCSHNMPIYGELGRYPLSITIKQRMICYWTRILKSNQHKLNKVMYDILYNLHFKDTHSILNLESNVLSPTCTICHSSSDTTWTLSEANKYAGVATSLTGRRRRQNL